MVRRRDQLEIKVLDSVISDEAYMRLKPKIEQELLRNRLLLSTFDDREKKNQELLAQAVKLAGNVSELYRRADHKIKRRLLGLFWSGFYVRDKNIVKAVPSDLISALNNDGLIMPKVINKVFISKIWCARQDSNL